MRYRQASGPGATMLTLLLTTHALATWSIVVADPETGRVGGAGTSCVGALDVAIIHGAVPGVGAVHAQARLNVAGRDEAVRLLGEGSAPDAIIAAMTDPDFDRIAAQRQYGVVDLQGRTAGFTGVDNGDWAGHTTGNAGSMAFSVQGNILTGPEVVQRSVDAFEASAATARPDACLLPERLLQALTAGRALGEGDSRCTGRGVPSDSAFLRVTEADGTVLVDLSVTETGAEDPLDLLAAELAAWRAENACPELSDPVDTDADTDIDEAGTGCGCATSAAGGWWVLGALVLFVRRSRRSERALRG